MPDEGHLERAIHQSETLERIVEKLALIERGQRVSLRRLRKLPDLTATAMAKAVSRKVLFFIGVGIALGAALGGAGIELSKVLIATATGWKP